MTVTQAEGFPGSKIAEKVETCTQTQDLLARVAKIQTRIITRTHEVCLPVFGGEGKDKLGMGLLCGCPQTLNPRLLSLHKWPTHPYYVLPSCLKTMQKSLQDSITSLKPCSVSSLGYQACNLTPTLEELHDTARMCWWSWEKTWG